MSKNNNTPSVTCINKSGKDLSTHVELTSDDLKYILSLKTGFIECQKQVLESFTVFGREIDNLSKSLDSTKKELQEQKNEVQKLKEAVSILINNNNNTSSSTSISELQQRVDRLESHNLSTEIILSDKMITEISNRIHKTSNLLIHGVPEKETKNNNFNQLVKVIKSIDKTFDKKSVTLERIGLQKHNKVRPIKIHFKNKKSIPQILKHKNLFPKEYVVTQDRTKKQREQYNKLVKSVKHLNNLNSSEKRSVVKYVNGIPKIVPDMVNRPVKYVGAAGDENSTSGTKFFSDTSEKFPMCGEQCVNDKKLLIIDKENII